MQKFLLSILVALSLTTNAQAAGTANSFITPQIPNNGKQQWTASPNTYKIIYTAGANGSRCYGLWATTSDATQTHVVTVQIFNAAVVYGGMNFTTVLGAGYSSPAQALLTPTLWPGLPLDQYGNPYIQLVSGDTLQASYATALTASTFINIVAFCSDF